MSDNDVSYCSSKKKQWIDIYYDSHHKPFCNNEDSEADILIWELFHSNSIGNFLIPF